jgi:hypothetical protein
LQPSDSDELDGREIRSQAQKACAIAHGRGAGLSSNELWLIVLKDGLPNEDERERILAEKLRSDDED